MHQLSRLFKSRTTFLLLFAGLLVFAGCKIDINNEVWLNKNGSGKALIKTYVEYANLEEFSNNGLAEENVLQNYIDLINETKGAELISQKITDYSDEEIIAADFEVIFNFDKVETLSKIMAVQDKECFALSRKGKTNTLYIYPTDMSLIDENELKDETMDYLDFDINFALAVHAPAKIREFTEDSATKTDKKSVEWKFAIDDAWFDNPVTTLTVVY